MPQSLSACFQEIAPGTKSQWSPEKMPSQKGRVAVVTGGYTGIGLETVDALLQHDIAKVFIAGRSQQKYQAAVEELQRRGVRTEGVLEFLECDLASLKSVKKAGETLKAKTDKLHMLFASAGVMVPPFGSRSEDGIELQLATNVLGHHYLIKLALPLLQAAKTPQFSPRVALTSSSGHNFIVGSPAFSKRDPEQTTRPIMASTWVPKDVKQWIQYGNSKIGNILTANKFHRLYGPSQGIVFASCNPGNLRTELTRHMASAAQKIMVRALSATLLFPAKYGALNQLWICTSDEGERMGGSYVAPWTRLVSPSSEARDQVAEDELFEWCEEQIRRVVGTK